MFMLSAASSSDIVASYGLDARLLVVGIYLIVFVLLDYIGDWLGLSFVQAVFRMRIGYPLFYLTLKSRLFVSPFLIAFVFLIPRGNEPPSDLLDFRYIAAIIVGIIGVGTTLYLSYRDTRQF